MTASIFFQIGTILTEDFYQNLYLLSENERQRCLRYQHQTDKLRFACTRIALKKLLAKLTGEHPKQIVIQNTLQGQPFYKQPDKSWQIAVSHSEQHYLIAATYDSLLIGTDLEHCDGSFEFPETIINSFCHQEEIARLAALPRQKQTMVTKNLWSAKEAILKAAGVGLLSDPCALLLPVPLPAQCELIFDGQPFYLAQYKFDWCDTTLLMTLCSGGRNADWFPINPATQEAPIDTFRRG